MTSRKRTRGDEVPYNDYFQTKGWEDRYIVVDADQDGETWIKECGEEGDANKVT